MNINNGIVRSKVDELTPNTCGNSGQFRIPDK